MKNHTVVSRQTRLKFPYVETKAAALRCGVALTALLAISGSVLAANLVVGDLKDEIVQASDGSYYNVVLGNIREGVLELTDGSTVNIGVENQITFGQEGTPHELGKLNIDNGSVLDISYGSPADTVLFTGHKGEINITDGGKLFILPAGEMKDLKSGVGSLRDPGALTVNVSGSNSTLAVSSDSFDFYKVRMNINNGALVDLSDVEITLFGQSEINIVNGALKAQELDIGAQSSFIVDGAAASVDVEKLYIRDSTFVVRNGAILTANSIDKDSADAVLAIGSEQGQAATAAGHLNIDAIDVPIHLVFNHTDNAYDFSAKIEAQDSDVNIVAGRTIFTSDSTYRNGTTIGRTGILQLGNGGSTGSILGNVVNDGVLAFDHEGAVIFDGAISGLGRVIKEGSKTLTLSGDNSFSGGLNIESGTAKAGITGHAFGSGVLSVEKNGTADLGNFNTTTGGLSGSGKVELGTGTLTLDQMVDTTFSGTLDGTGGLTKNGEGNLTLSGTSSYSGATQVNAGALTQSAAGAFSGGSDYFVGTAGTLDLGGFGATVASLANDGTVMFGGAGGTVLRVAGNYTVDNGAVVINTVLGDDNSRTDMLQVDGNTSGSGKIYVKNQGGTGAQTVNGIKIVNVDGSSDGKFSLANSYTTKDGQQAVVGGAYAYTLQRGGDKTPTDGDWYLVNHMTNPDTPVDPNCAQTNGCPPTPPTPPAPRFSAGAPVYEGYVQNMLTLNKLPTLQQRVGNRTFTGANGADRDASVNGYGLWGRVEGAHNRLEPSTSTARMKQDINTLQMQAGVDGQFYEGDNGRLIAGITGQYGHAKGDISSLYGDGSIGTDAWSLGATATWYGNDGFYLDTQGQVTWFDNDLDSWTANQGLANGRKATGYALSAEAGKRLAIGGNWALTPQAQLAWSSIHADAFRDVWDARVSVDDGSSFLGRLGLAAEYATQWKDESGRTTNAHVYGIANLYQEFRGGTTVNLAGVDFDTDNDRTWAGVGAGGTYAWADNKYALYGEGSINTGLNHFAQSYSFKANVGFKANW